MSKSNTCAEAAQLDGRFPGPELPRDAWRRAALERAFAAPMRRRSLTWWRRLVRVRP